MTESFFRKIKISSEENFKKIQEEINKKEKENFKDGYFTMTGGDALFKNFQFN